MILDMSTDMVCGCRHSELINVVVRYNMTTIVFIKAVIEVVPLVHTTPLRTLHTWLSLFCTDLQLDIQWCGGPDQTWHHVMTWWTDHLTMACQVVHVMLRMLSITRIVINMHTIMSLYAPCAMGMCVSCITLQVICDWTNSPRSTWCSDLEGMDSRWIHPCRVSDIIMVTCWRSSLPFAHRTRL